MVLNLFQKKKHTQKQFAKVRRDIDLCTHLLLTGHKYKQKLKTTENCKGYGYGAMPLSTIFQLYRGSQF